MKRLFTLLNRVNTIGRASLTQTQLNSLLQILMEVQHLLMSDHSRPEGALNRVCVIRLREPSGDTEQI